MVIVCSHAIGADYSYTLVAYDDWFIHLTGESLNEILGWKGDNFDRVVHFFYGLLLAYRIPGVYLRIAVVRNF